MPMWSELHRITEQLLNLYKLETLNGQPLEGEYHTRQLRRFPPREGMELASQQKEIEARLEEEVTGETEREDSPEVESSITSEEQRAGEMGQLGSERSSRTSLNLRGPDGTGGMDLD